jgi:hypothetical protein
LNVRETYPAAPTVSPAALAGDGWAIGDAISTAQNALARKLIALLFMQKRSSKNLYNGIPGE